LGADLRVSGFSPTTGRPLSIANPDREVIGKHPQVMWSRKGHAVPVAPAGCVPNANDPIFYFDFINGEVSNLG